MTCPMFGGVAPSHLVTPFHAVFPGRARAARGSWRRGVPRILLVAGARPRPPARNTVSLLRCPAQVPVGRLRRRCGGRRPLAVSKRNLEQRIHQCSGLGDLTRISERLAAARFGVSPTMPRSCASPEPITSPTKKLPKELLKIPAFTVLCSACGPEAQHLSRSGFPHQCKVRLSWAGISARRRHVMGRFDGI